jgi:hypothetical protein
VGGWGGWIMAGDIWAGSKAVGGIGRAVNIRSLKVGPLGGTRRTGTQEVKVRLIHVRFRA